MILKFLSLSNTIYLVLGEKVGTEVRVTSPLEMRSDFVGFYVLRNKEDLESISR